MEQLSIRDWMVIVGGVMIAAVLVDAGRRLLKERRAEIRLNARIERSKSSSNEDDAFNLLTELPNGGARIVRRDDLAKIHPVKLIPAQDQKILKIIRQQMVQIFANSICGALIPRVARRCLLSRQNLHEPT